MCYDVRTPNRKEAAINTLPNLTTAYNTCNRFMRSRERTIVRRFAGLPNGFYSGRKGVGIGADDRAGCAALWLLRDLPNASLLIVPEEETGCRGSGAIMADARGRAAIGDHAFAIQFDRRGDSDCVFYDLDDDSRFIPYVLDAMGAPYDYNGGSFSDISEICPAMGFAGVNLSIGFDNEHTPNEILDLAAFARTVSRVRAWLTNGGVRRFDYSAQAAPSRWGYPSSSLGSQFNTKPKSAEASAEVFKTADYGFDSIGDMIDDVTPTTRQDPWDDVWCHGCNIVTTVEDLKINERGDDLCCPCCGSDNLESLR
jgi:hypothetical protein